MEDRIFYQGSLKPVLEKVCERYDLGGYRSHSIVPEGLVDLNIELETSEGKFLVKILRKNRNDENSRKYVDTMVRASKKINHPEMINHGEGFYSSIEVDGVDLRLCVMEFIEGETLETRELSVEEAGELGRQAGKIKQIDTEPHTEYDSWALENFLYEFDKAYEHLKEEERKLLRELALEFRKIDLEELPACFVHGDIRPGNVIKGEELWIIDFGVSDYKPRIKEPAVVIATILLHEEDSTEKIEKFKEEYRKEVELSRKEEKLLPLFVNVALAMDYVKSAFYLRALDSDSEWMRRKLEKSWKILKERRN